jgi:hypothetical protein
MRKRSLLPFVFGIGLLGISADLQAQMPGPMSGPGGGMNAALTKLFGDVKSFTAQTEARILDKNQRETTSLTMQFALLDGKLRTELDMAQIKSAQMPPDAAQSMKQMGMDKIVSIMRPDRNSLYLVYPGLQSYAEMPIPKGEGVGKDDDFKLEKTAQGKETIDGHPCTKHKVVITNEAGERHEALVWNASDLKDFPIQMQVLDKEATVIMKYKDVKFVRPDEKLFDAPAGFTRYADMQQLMGAAMQKMMGGPGGKN